MTELTTGYYWRAKAAALTKKLMNPSLTPYFFKKSSPSSLNKQGKYFSDIWGSLHINFLESSQKSVVILCLFQSLRNSLSQSWHWFSNFFSFKWTAYTWRLSWSWSLFAWLRFFCFSRLRFRLLFFLWFRFLFFSLFFFSLLFWLLLFSLSSRFCAFWINIKQWLSYIQTITSTNVEFKKFTSVRALNFNSNFVSLYVGYSLILVDPFSFLWNYYQNLLLTN